MSELNFQRILALLLMIQLAVQSVLARVEVAHTDSALQGKKSCISTDTNRIRFTINPASAIGCRTFDPIAMRNVTVR
jgi:hypothetical protein